MDFQFTAEDEAFRQEVREFVRQELPDNWEGGERASCFESFVRFFLTENIDREQTDQIEIIKDAQTHSTQPTAQYRDHGAHRRR